MKDEPYTLRLDVKNLTNRRIYTNSTTFELSHLGIDFIIDVKCCDINDFMLEKPHWSFNTELKTLDCIFANSTSNNALDHMILGIYSKQHHRDIAIDKIIN